LLEAVCGENDDLFASQIHGSNPSFYSFIQQSIFSNIVPEKARSVGD